MTEAQFFTIGFAIAFTILLWTLEHYDPWMQAAKRERQK